MATIPDTRETPHQVEKQDRIANPYRDLPQEKKNEQDDAGVAGRYDGEDVETDASVAQPDRETHTHAGK
jgi:hypothetical protein